MAEYIDRTQMNWHCEYQDDHCNLEDCKTICPNLECGYLEVMNIPPADVIERSKIDKAIEEIIEKSFISDIYNDRTDDEIIKVDDVLEILKRKI